MDLIDRKLRDRGYVLNYHGSFSAGYYKILYDSAGKDTGKGQFVEIIQDFGPKKEVFIQSSIKGVGCGGGRSCSHPLSFPDFRLFYLKSLVLKAKWWLKLHFKRGSWR